LHGFGLEPAFDKIARTIPSGKELDTRSVPLGHIPGKVYVNDFEQGSAATLALKGRGSGMSRVIPLGTPYK